MSNLLEKSLLIGFGIFTLIIFASIIVPFINQITEYNKDRREELQNYLDFIEKIDSSIKSVINDPSQVYTRTILYPEKINITIQEYSIEYKFLLGDTFNSKTEDYSQPFYQCEYLNFPSMSYDLNVSIKSSFIKITFVPSGLL